MSPSNLRALYRAYSASRRLTFPTEARTITNVNERVLTASVARAVYDNYYRASFFRFCSHIKGLLHAKNIFEHIVTQGTEGEMLIQQIEFLVRRKVISVSRNGKVSAPKSVMTLFPKPVSENELIRKIERRLGLRVELEKPVGELFKNISDFSVKPQYDQLQISQGSAIREARTILDSMPIYGRFLCVGDDDFIAILLAIADPNLDLMVHDADPELLASIEAIAKRFSLRISVRRVDFRKNPADPKKYIGFSCNPPYTEKGVRKFVEYGVAHLGPDGGMACVVIGDSAIGNRFLFLQEALAKKNLIIRELLRGVVRYPFKSVYEEDKNLEQRLSKFIDRRIIAKNPHLGASLYTLEHIPFPVKRIKTRQPFYSYL